MILTLQPKEGVTLVAVEVPEGAFSFRREVYVYDGGQAISGLLPSPCEKDKWNPVWYSDKLPPGKYSIIGLLREIKEGQVDDLVYGYYYSNELLYKNYSNPKKHCQTAIESLHSLIRANGGNDKLNYLILKFEK